MANPEIDKSLDLKYCTKPFGFGAWIWIKILGAFKGLRRRWFFLLVFQASIYFAKFGIHTLPKTNSSTLKIVCHPKRKQSYSNHPFSGLNSLFVSGRVILSDSHVKLSEVLVADFLEAIFSTLSVTGKGARAEMVGVCKKEPGLPTPIHLAPKKEGPGE